MNYTCGFEDVTQLNNASPEEHVMSGHQDGRSDGTLVEELAASIARVSDSVSAESMFFNEDLESDEELENIRSVGL